MRAKLQAGTKESIVALFGRWRGGGGKSTTLRDDTAHLIATTPDRANFQQPLVHFRGKMVL
jgi:hypothetical protein